MENSYYSNTKPCLPFGDFQARGNGSASTVRPYPPRQHAAFLTSPPQRGQFTQPQVPAGPPSLSHGQVYTSNHGSSNALGQAPFQLSQQFGGRLPPMRAPTAQFQAPAGTNVGDFPRASMNVNVPPPTVNVNIYPPLPRLQPVNRSIPPPSFNLQVPPSDFNPQLPPPPDFNPQVPPQPNFNPHVPPPSNLNPQVPPPTDFSPRVPPPSDFNPHVPPPVVGPPTSAGAFVRGPTVLPPALPASSHTSWMRVAGTREHRPRIPHPAMISHVTSQRRMFSPNSHEHMSSSRAAFSSSDGRLSDLPSVLSSAARTSESSITLVRSQSAVAGGVSVSLSAADHKSQLSGEVTSVVAATSESAVTSRRRRRPDTSTNVTVSCSCHVLSA